MEHLKNEDIVWNFCRLIRFRLKKNDGVSAKKVFAQLFTFVFSKPRDHFAKVSTMFHTYNNTACALHSKKVPYIHLSHLGMQVQSPEPRARDLRHRLREQDSPARQAIKDDSESESEPEPAARQEEEELQLAQSPFPYWEILSSSDDDEEPAVGPIQKVEELGSSWQTPIVVD